MAYERFEQVVIKEYPIIPIHADANYFSTGGFRVGKTSSSGFYMREEGWRGIDNSSFDFGSSNPIGVEGGFITSRRGSQRQITIPLVARRFRNNETATDAVEDIHLRAGGTGNPLAIGFLTDITNDNGARFLGPAYLSGGFERRNRLGRDYRYDLNFISEFPHYREIQNTRSIQSILTSQNISPQGDAGLKCEWGVRIQGRINDPIEIIITDINENKIHSRVILKPRSSSSVNTTISFSNPHRWITETRGNTHSVPNTYPVEANLGIINPYLISNRPYRVEPIAVRGLTRLDLWYSNSFYGAK